jgi:class 3 adenylate cyclase
MVLRMGAGLGTEVLLALLDAPEDGLLGGAVLERLEVHGSKPPRSDELLLALLRLEGSGHVVVHRNGSLRFTLTSSGRAHAIELGGGQPVHVRLLMADLVGYVAYTVAHGDEAARHTSATLAGEASAAVRQHGGEVVKGLGDGFLAWLPPAADPLPVVRQVAARLADAVGHAWQLRAASHVGRPIRQGGDLFGGDVNLVARLCAAAGADELVVTSDRGREQLELRGLAAPVVVDRVALR